MNRPRSYHFSEEYAEGALEIANGVLAQPEKIIEWVQAQVHTDNFLALSPIFVANAMPVMAKAILKTRLSAPISVEMLGANKTWRGAAAATLGGAATGVALELAGVPLPLDGYLWGGYLGFASIAGDAVGSFIKRRMRVPPGGKVPWDGFDHAALGGLVAAFFEPKMAIPAIMLGTASPILSRIANIIAYKRGWKDVPH